MKVQVLINGRPYEVEVEDTDERSSKPKGRDIQSVVLSLPGAAVTVDDHGKIYRSPLAGLVVAVKVEVGQAVQMNDELLVLEAMKMETRMTSAVAGKVKCLHVVTGAAVKLNQVLLELE